MRLITAHKVLIGGALGLSILLILRFLVLYARAHQAGDLGFLFGSLALALGFALYLRAIWAR